MASSDSPLYTSKVGQGSFNVPGVTELGKSKKQAVQGEVTRYVDNYLDSHSEDGKQEQRETALKNRREHAKDVATNFYSLVTDFYEYGYGHSFHFAPIYDGKSLPECIAIYEQGVAKLLKAKPGMKLLVSQHGTLKKHILSCSSKFTHLKYIFILHSNQNLGKPTSSK